MSSPSVRLYEPFDMQKMLTRLVARSLVGAGLLYIVPVDGISRTSDKIKVAAGVSLASLASERWVEPTLNP